MLVDCCCGYLIDSFILLSYLPKTYHNIVPILLWISTNFSYIMTSTILKIDPDRLLKEELEFEISLRGFNPTGSVSELISIFCSLLKLESEGQRFSISYNRDPETELEICQKKT